MALEKGTIPCAPGDQCIAHPNGLLICGGRVRLLRDGDDEILACRKCGRIWGRLA